MLEKCIIRTKAGVRAKLASSGIDPNDVSGLDDVFSDMVKPFAGLETEFKQESYFRDVLGLLVSCTSSACTEKFLLTKTFIKHWWNNFSLMQCGRHILYVIINTGQKYDKISANESRWRY